MIPVDLVEWSLGAIVLFLCWGCECWGGCFRSSHGAGQEGECICCLCRDSVVAAWCSHFLATPLESSRMDYIFNRLLALSRKALSFWWFWKRERRCMVWYGLQLLTNKTPGHRYLKQELQNGPENARKEEHIGEEIGKAERRRKAEEKVQPCIS